MSRYSALRKINESEKQKILSTLAELASSERICTPSDWILVDAKTFRKYEGSHYHNSSLKLFFNDEVGLLITEFLPHLKLTRWEFKHKPRGFWESLDRCREYLTWVTKQEKLKSIEELQKLPNNVFREKYYGKSILKRFHYNTFDMLTTVFPEIQWDILGFNYPLGYFDEIEKRVLFVKEIGQRNGLIKAIDFNKLNQKMFQDSVVGRRLLSKIYNGSPSIAAREAFPNYDFKEWLFDRIPKGFWDDVKNQRLAVEWLVNDILLITEFSDFYLIREKDFNENGLGSLLRIHRGSKNTLVNLFPEYEFETQLFDKIGRGAQRLFSILNLMYPDCNPVWRYKHHQLRFAKSGYPIEIDIFFPEQLLAIEFQGTQHKTMPEIWGNQASQLARDEEKRQLLEKANIDLIEIWDDDWSGRPSDVCLYLQNTKLTKIALPSERLANVKGKKILPDEAPWDPANDKKIENKNKNQEIWDFRYEQLLSNIQLYKTDLAEGLNIQNTELKRWLEAQINLQKKSLLSKVRKRKLEDLGISFPKPKRDLRWDEMFTQLQIFKHEHGHLLVPIKYTENMSLGVWVDTQRQMAKTKKLSEERKEKLNSVGFVWDVLRETEDKMLDDYHKFNSYSDTKKMPKALQEWATNIRQRKKKNLLSSELEKKLDTISFEWAPNDKSWTQKLVELRKYYDKFGHTNLKKGEASLELIRWCSKQRQAFQNGKLDPNKKQKLDDLKFSFSPHDVSWNNKYQDLQQFQLETGELEPTRKQNKTLYDWLAAQKQLQRKGVLKLSRRKLLEELKILSIKDNSAK